MRTRIERPTRYAAGNGVSLHVSSEVYIDRPGREVWDLLADPRRWPDWSPICIHCCARPSGAFAAGAFFKMRLDFRVVAVDVAARLIRLQPHKEICWETAIYGVRVLHRYSVRSEGEGSILTNEELFAGLRLPLAYLVRSWFRLTDLSLESLRAIKQLAEGTRR